MTERLAVTWLMPCLHASPGSGPKGGAGEGVEGGLAAAPTLLPWAVRCMVSPFLRPYVGSYDAGGFASRQNTHSSTGSSGDSSDRSSSDGSPDDHGSYHRFSDDAPHLPWDASSLPPGLLDAAMRQAVRRLAMLFAACVILACITR